MLLTAKIDQRKLAAAIRKAVKGVGESGGQGLARWGVECCRSLSRATQPWGVSPKSHAKGVGAIYKDARNVLLEVPAASPSNRRAVHSVKEAYEWVEVNRTRRRARTAELPIDQRKLCTTAIFHGACKIRIARVGFAKAGWIEAGQEIARTQQGLEKIQIGKGWIPWAQRASSGKKIGSGSLRGSLTSPHAIISSLVSYSGVSDVLAPSQAVRAVSMAGKNILKRYEKILSRKLK